MKTLIGSRAIKFWFPDFPREPKDYDFIVDTIGSIGPNEEQYVIPAFEGYRRIVMTPNDLYTLKVSHLFWDIKWSKHMYDVVFLKSKGCVLNQGLFCELYNHWRVVHKHNRRSNLNMKAADFFNNALKKYDHEALHRIINPVPSYIKILEDGQEVMISEKKWNALSHEEKLQVVREETYVMAFERLAGRDYRTAYYWMIKQMIISHLPMYAAVWAIENYYELRKPLFNYKQKIENEL